MEIIIPQAREATLILGEQKKKEDVTYRPLKYLFIEPCDDGVLIYNAVTLELILLTKEEADNMLQMDELITKWFLVPDYYNDTEFADQLRAVAMEYKKPLKYTTFYKIFTTTHCNARCYYCFENNFHNKKTMTPETAEKLVEYIVKNSYGRKVKLEWFGGEPLVNMDAIDIVCDGLTEKGVDFYSVMVTNGYLFDPETVAETAKRWHLEIAQITLDGTEETYNRIKAYVNPQGSPFKRVMDNIEALMDAGLWVNITMNVSEENFEDQLALADLLAERFKDRKNFGAYTAPIMETKGFKPGEIGEHMTAIEQNVIKMNVVLRHLRELGLSRVRTNDRMKRNVRVWACMAEAEGGCTTVLPDGTLGFCGVVSDGETYGSVYTEERDQEMLARWHEPKLRNGPACDGCLQYPLCLFLKQCPEQICSIETQKKVVNGTRHQIYNEYEIYKIQKQEKQEKQ